tara:strand:- start:287 stop:1150 length:864 start_codon:yes stop_codon:yes gene_type:complete
MTTYTDFSSITDNVTIGLTAETETVYREANDQGTTGYTFELLGFDISHDLTVDPSFAQAIAQVAGLAADAIVEFDASATDFDGMFQIKLDSSDILDASASDILYGVSADYTFPTLAYSSGTVGTGKMNSTAGYNQALEYDLVRHLAYSVTGGYAAADIFSNEASLRADVVSRDAEFNTSFQGVLTDLSATFADIASITAASDPELIAAVNLLTVTLNDSDDSYARRSALLTDISSAGTAVTGQIQVPLKFVAGDKLVMKLNYEPNARTPIGANSISDRSYKVVVTLN